MKKKIKCFECKKEIEVETSSRYRRKYCEECSAKRKKMWDEQWKVKYEDLPDDDDED